MGNAAMDSRHTQLDWTRLQNTANVVMDKSMQLFVMSSLPLCNKGGQHVLNVHANFGVVHLESASTI